ncbi:hypothetical protein V6K52_03460 [Knoellia sp. S7-12]|uniref:hypothetical protein n=1 Tax=Knoellia sp. S7-12 TaxID=3126698 RepID=UPI00336893A9
MSFDLEDDGFVGSVGGQEGHQLHVLGHGWIVQPKHHDFVASEEVIAAANIESLRAAMLDGRRCCSQLPGSTEYVHVALEHGADFHALTSPVDPVTLWVESDRVFAVIETQARRKPPWNADELSLLLAPAASQYGCAIERVLYESHGGDPADWDGLGLDREELEELHRGGEDEPHEIHVRVAAEEALTVSELLAAGRAVKALLAAHQGGALDVETVRNLLRGGHPSLLVGLSESEWFEVKAQAYNIGVPGVAGERQKIELAQDVARFANGETDALLVIGLREGKGARKHAVDAVTPVPISAIDVDRYRAVLDSKIIPPVDGLRLEQIELGHGCGLLLINVPRQARELQPFLVHGAIVADKVEGAFFSIVRRRGEGSIVTTAAQIHAYIVAGRAFLRNEQDDGQPSLREGIHEG